MNLNFFKIFFVFLLVFNFGVVHNIHAQEVAEEQGDGEEEENADDEQGEEDDDDDNDGGEVDENAEEEKDKEDEDGLIKKIASQIVSYTMVGQIAEFPKNTATFFVEIDRLLFNLSGFRDDNIFIENKYLFGSIGVFLGVFLLFVNTGYAIWKNEDVEGIATRGAIRFIIFPITLLAFMFFVIGATKLTDVLSASMFKVTLGEQYHEAVVEYYKFEKEYVETDDWEERRDATLDGTRVSGGAMAYSFIFGALDVIDGDEEDDIGDKAKNLAIGFFMTMIFITSFYIVMIFLVLYALVRSVLIIAIVLMSPFLLALPIFEKFKTINIFSLVLAICLQHIAITFSFCITFLYFINGSTSGMALLMMPLIMFFGAIGFMFLFSSFINVGATSPMNYTTGMQYARGGYATLRKFTKKMSK